MIYLRIACYVIGFVGVLVCWHRKDLRPYFATVWLACSCVLAVAFAADEYWTMTVTIGVSALIMLAYVIVDRIDDQRRVREAEENYQWMLDHYWKATDTFSTYLRSQLEQDDTP